MEKPGKYKSSNMLQIRKNANKMHPFNVLVTHLLTY